MRGGGRVIVPQKDSILIEKKQMRKGSPYSSPKQTSGLGLTCCLVPPQHSGTY